MCVVCVCGVYVCIWCVYGVLCVHVVYTCVVRVCVSVSHVRGYVSMYVDMQMFLPP